MKNNASKYPLPTGKQWSRLPERVIALEETANQPVEPGTPTEETAILKVTGNGTMIAPVINYGIGSLQLMFSGGGMPYVTPYEIVNFVSPIYRFESYSATSTELVLETPKLSGVIFKNINNMVKLELPNLTSFYTFQTIGSFGQTSISINISNNLALTTLSIPKITSISLPTIMDSYIFSGNALNQESVDHIINLFYLYAPTSTNSPTIDLSGGLNSTPSATGLAQIAAIQSRGWLVSYN